MGCWPSKFSVGRRSLFIVGLITFTQLGGPGFAQSTYEHDQTPEGWAFKKIKEGPQAR